MWMTLNAFHDGKLTDSCLFDKIEAVIFKQFSYLRLTIIDRIDTCQAKNSTGFGNYAWVAEVVDARDLKSLGAKPCTSSSLVPGTNLTGV